DVVHPDHAFLALSVAPALAEERLISSAQAFGFLRASLSASLMCNLDEAHTGFNESLWIEIAVDEKLLNRCAIIGSQASIIYGFRNESADARMHPASLRKEDASVG